MGLKIRRDTAATWTSVDPTLEQAEQGYETDTGKWKFGDGVTAWTLLPYSALGNVTGQASSVDSEVALFSGTGGKTIKRATTTGILKGTSGVLSAAVANTDYATPNQDTTGKSAKTDALNSATTVVNVAAATAPTSGQVLTATGGTAATWQTPAAGAGTVTTVSVVSANGLAGSVANATTTPAITLSTSITGVLKGNGTAVSAATAGTDYYNPGGTDVAVVDGGTGASTLTNGGVLKGHGTSAVTADATINDLAAQTGNYNANSNKITSLADPTNPQDAATKAYIDAAAPAACRVATTGAETFTIAAGSVTQITGTAVDGVTCGTGDRILIKDAPAATGAGSANSTQPGNGIYSVTSSIGNLTVARANDMTGTHHPQGHSTLVEAGTANASVGFVVTTPSSSAAFTYGTDSIAWTKYSGPLDADLTTIAGLTATTDNFIQAKSSAWASRTVAQVKTDLGLTGTNSGDQTITLTGDVTGTGTGTFAATIANDAVTYAKMQNVSATDKLLGRSTAGAGDVEEITLTAAGRALIDDAAAVNQRTTLGLVIGTDVVAPNQDTTGKSAKTDALNSATTVVNVAAATAPSSGQVLTATSGTAATWQTPSGGGTWGSITGTLSAQTDLDTALAGKQPLDSDLTTIAGLTATTDSFLQSKASAWASRTVAQVKTDLGLTGTNSGDQTITLTGDVTGTGTGSFATTGVQAAKWTTARNLAGNSVDGSAAVAFANKFIVQGTTDTGLSAAQFLGALATGIVKNTTTTGVLSIATAGTDYTTPTSTETQTNKRKTPRVYNTTSTATLTPEIDTYDAFFLTAQAAALNIANHSTSTPTDFETIRIRIIDNGTARAITYGTNFDATSKAGIALPSTTVLSKYLEMGFEWWAGALNKYVLVFVAFGA